MNKRTIESSNFNSPFELGLRALIILNKRKSDSIDLQRILIYDYLVIHSSDVNNGPKSIHPKTPFRASGIFIRRKVMQDGLDIMYSKNLLDIVYDGEGISYKSTKLTTPFLELLNSSYFEKLRVNSDWVIKNFSEFSSDQLGEYIKTNISNWGGEYEFEYFFKEGKK